MAQRRFGGRHMAAGWALALSGGLSGCGVVENLTTTPVTVAAVSAQHLAPGASVSVPIDVTLAGRAGGQDVQLSVQSADAALVTATLEGRTLTLRAAAGALPQGLVPVTVTAQVGEDTATRRIGVEIGSRISAEFARFNAVRAQAGLRAVVFDDEASMNCWLHGRYSVLNGAAGHNEDASLPYATPQGLNCAANSNLSWNTLPVAKLAGSTSATDTLFSVPFHAAGMLHSGQTHVGIGSYARPYPNDARYVQTGSGITSIRPEGAGAGAPVTFPGNGQETDLAQYPGGEWPNPLTSCAGFDPRSTGLPLVVASRIFGDTTATDATLSVEGGGSVEVCAYGSTQYVNTTDAPGNYVGGPRSAQDIGRSILKGYGAVFVIPRAPLVAGKTYRVSVTVNGTPVTWSFRTAATLRPQTLARPGVPLRVQ